MSLNPDNILVATNGNVFVAPEGTARPASLTGSPASPWIDLGYVDDQGVTVTHDQNTQEIPAWQATGPVRILVVSEPKVVKFTLLQIDAEEFRLAMRGGEFVAGASGSVIYNPPAAGSSDVRALLVNASDDDVLFSFYFPRVRVNGTVESVLQRQDAAKLPLEMAVLEAQPRRMQVQSNHPDWIAAVPGDG